MKEHICRLETDMCLRENTMGGRGCYSSGEHSLVRAESVNLSIFKTKSRDTTALAYKQT